jgi:putative endonuclease
MASISGTLYTGFCNDIYIRALQHKNGEGGAFTKRYKCDRLVYYKQFRYVFSAIRAEKQIKGWKRGKKVTLIESVNPKWQDLAMDWGKPLDKRVRNASAS